jgi:hypothetical protein
MHISYTAKTVTLTCEPGERWDVDRDGFSVSSRTYRWAGVEYLKKEVAENIKARKSDNDYNEDRRLQDIRSNLIRDIESLPIYRTNRVWTGHNQ